MNQREQYRDCLAYVDAYWARIIRQRTVDDGTLIGLPHRYVCSNHDMFQELYYWDSYFIMLGLEGTRNQDLIVEMTENLASLMTRFGRIPNANRYYHLSRSQPPFLTSMIRKSYQVKLSAREPRSGANEWLAARMAVAQAEYKSVWRGKKFPDSREVYRGLSRYYDLNIWHNAAEAESGWDMTNRFEDRCLDFIPIDLNCLLFQYEQDFAWTAQIINDSSGADHWLQEAKDRQAAVSEELWDNDTGFFYDFDVRRGRRSNRRTVAGFYPLWSRLATEEQAERVVKTHLRFFEMAHGIVTTENLGEQVIDFSKQWAWPNGWAPLQWIVISGLEKYGYHDDAQRIAEKWVNLVNRVFEQNQVNFEKYNVVEGARATPDRYPDQAGFAWTNAVFARLVRFLETGKLWTDDSIAEGAARSAP